MIDKITRIEPVFAPASDVTPVPVRDSEPLWTSSPSGSANHRWLWKGVGAFLLFMIAMIALFYFVSQQQTGSTNTLATLEVISQEYDPQSPLYIFQQDPGKAQEECLSVLRRYSTATTLQDVLPLVRTSSEIKAALATSWKPWPSAPILDDGTCDATFDETSGRAYFMIHGSLQNGKPFTAYFVSQGNKLVLDWEATMGHGEMSLAEILRHAPEKPVTMRLSLTPSPYYMPSLSEKEYESYRIQDITNENYGWAYVVRDSPAHQQIQVMLQSGAILLEQLNESTATVKIQKIKDHNRENQFFITDMLHKGWVMP